MFMAGKGSISGVDTYGFVGVVMYGLVVTGKPENA